MAEGSWSSSRCKPWIWLYSISGQGSYTWTADVGTHWVGGGQYQVWAGQGYECGILAEAVKDAGWVAEMNYGKGCPGQWFRGGAVGYHDGAWHIMYGNYGQAGLFSRFRRRKPEVRIEGTTLGPAEAAAPSGTPPITAEMVAAKASRR